jgi:GNAT superfamily N-acetyltransferase
VPHLDVALRQGRVRLRLARHDDADALEVGFNHLSADSRYTRFFTAMPRLSGSVFERLIDLDGHDRVAIAAFDPDRSSEIGSADGYGIGVGRFVRSERDDVAELAVAVIDEYQRRGIGRLLLLAVFVAAHVRGITCLQASVLGSNGPMLTLLERLGAVDHTEPDVHDVRLLEVDVPSTVEGLAADDDLVPLLSEVLS